MTFNESFDQVTLWDCLQHQQYTLQGRVETTQIDNLKAYLVSQELSSKER